MNEADYLTATLTDQANALGEGLCPHRCAEMVATPLGLTCPECGWNEYGRHVETA